MVLSRLHTLPGTHHPTPTGLELWSIKSELEVGVSGKRGMHALQQHLLRCSFHIRYLPHLLRYVIVLSKLWHSRLGTEYKDYSACVALFVITLHHYPPRRLYMVFHALFTSLESLWIET